MLKKSLRSALAIFLVLAMLLSMSSTILAVEASEKRIEDLLANFESLTADKKHDRDYDTEINYVSLGDSMTNGYGFKGYKQNSDDRDVYDFINGKGVYGDGSYALQFEEYLAGKYGVTVNHTKLAPSALMADDLLYLLGARDEEFNDDWNGYRDYVGTYSDDELKAHFQEAVTDADIITLCIGNASFGAFLVQKITETIGIMGEAPEIDPNLTLENGLALLENEDAKKVVLDIYNDMKTELAKYTNAIPMDINVGAILDLVAYTAASFMVSYEVLVDTIIEMNPDVEIILVGLMNTTYGMTITGEGFEFPFGDMMDNTFEALNNYIAGVPAAKQIAGEYEEATFYYADQPAPEFIVQAFDDLAANDWNNIDNGRLSGEIVRQRNLEAYNGQLRQAIGGTLGLNLPAVTIEDVSRYTFISAPNGQIEYHSHYEAYVGDSAFWQGKVRSGRIPVQEATNYEISIAIYLAIEEAVVANVDTMEISVGGLMGIAGNIFDALGDMPEELSQNPGPYTIKTALVNWFNGSENGRAMCKVYALFKVGNGMSVHPTPTGHDNIFKAVVDAYENEYTAAHKVFDTAISLIKEYYDEAYAYGYDYAVEAGYIKTATDAIDGVIAEVEALKDLYADLEMTDAFRSDLDAEIVKIVDALESAKALLNNADELDSETLELALATLDDAYAAIAQLGNIVEQAAIDVNNLVIIPAIEAAKLHIETVVIPAAIEAAELAAEKAYEYLVEALGVAYDYLVDTLVWALETYLPELDRALYDYFYNNPEEVIGFFTEYGDEIVGFMAEYGDEALAVLGYVLYTYGEDIVRFVIENDEAILAAMVNWMDAYGERTVELIQVYAEALGLCDAVRDQIDALEDAIAALDAQAKAQLKVLEAQLIALNEQLENAVGEVKAQIEAQIAAVEAQIEAIKAQVEAQIATIKAKIEAVKTQIDELIKSGFATIEDVKAAIAELDKAVTDLITAVKQLGIDTFKDAIVNIADALTALDTTIEKLCGDAYNKFKDQLNGYAMQALDQLYAAVKKFLPELDRALYDYLYNNPDEVIGFFNEYGYIFADLAKEYGDEALAIVGFILYYYGEDVAEYVIENHEEILSALTEWWGIYGERTVELIQVYAEALGLCDAVRDQIDALEAQLEKLYAELERVSAEAKIAIEAQIEIVKAQIEILNAKVEALLDKVDAIILDVNAKVEDAIAQVKALLDQIDAAIIELNAQVEALIAQAIADARAAADAALEALYAELGKLLEAQIDDLQDLAEALEAKLIEALEALDKLIQHYIYLATHDDYTVDCQSYYVSLGDTTALGLGTDAYADMLAEKLGLEADQYVELALAGLRTNDLRAILDDNFTSDDYFNGEVLELINKAGGIDAVREAYKTELTKADLVTLSIGNANFLGFEETGIITKWVKNDADLMAWIENRYFGEAITEALTQAGIDLNAETYTPDWDAYLSEKEQAKLFEAIDFVKAELIKNGIPEVYSIDIGVMLELPIPAGTIVLNIPVADLIAEYIEWCAYGYAIHVFNYIPVVSKIREMTGDDADIVVLGMVNPMDDLTVIFGDAEISVGDYLDTVFGSMDISAFGYAVINNENTTYVSVPEVDCAGVDTENTVDVFDVLIKFVTEANGNFANLPVTADGHKYIADRIYGALTVTDVGHDYDAVVTAPDCTNGGYTTYTCTVCGDSYVGDETEALGHDYDAVVTAPDCTNGGYTTYTCTVCGHSYVGDETEALGHDYDAVVTAPDCTNGGFTTYTCTVCGDSYVGDETEALGHDYDAVVTAPDCTNGGYTTYTCKVCGDTYVADETEALGHDHKESARVDATCTEKGKVTYTCACGDSYEEEIPATGHTDDAFCKNCGEFLCDFSDNCPSKNFIDVETEEWYHEAIDFVIDAGIMNGIGGSKFAPAGVATRAMVITTLYRLEGSPAVSGKASFSDVEDGSWYTDAVIWATEKGITKGIGGGKFAPAAEITREQLVVMFYRYLEMKDVNVSAANDLKKYVDASQVSEWALAEMKWAVEVGFINGRTASLLAPGANAQRSELATLIMRMCKNLLK